MGEKSGRHPPPRLLPETELVEEIGARSEKAQGLNRETGPCPLPRSFLFALAVFFGPGQKLFTIAVAALGRPLQVVVKLRVFERALADGRGFQPSVFRNLIDQGDDVCVVHKRFIRYLPNIVKSVIADLHLIITKRMLDL